MEVLQLSQTQYTPNEILNVFSLNLKPSVLSHISNIYNHLVAQARNLPASHYHSIQRIIFFIIQLPTLIEVIHFYCHRHLSPF